MSLDVYLINNEEELQCHHCGGTGRYKEQSEAYSANITHNLAKMADAATIYYPLWRPEEIGITKAAQLIQPLTQGLELLKGDPESYRKYDAPNGWGLYEHFVPWVEKYLQACKDNPDALVRASR